MTNLYTRLETWNCKWVDVKALAGEMQFHTGVPGGYPCFASVRPARGLFIAGCVGLFSWKTEHPVRAQAPLQGL